MTVTDASALPDYVPVPPSARPCRQPTGLLRRTDRTESLLGDRRRVPCAFLTTPDGVVLFDGRRRSATTFSARSTRSQSPTA